MRKAVMPGISPQEAVTVYGGYARYYHSTESCRDLANLAEERKLKHVLACCGGGDQALTFLAGLEPKGSLWAFDLQPAQLFVLAAKALYLAGRKTPPFYPSFSVIQKMYPGQISPQPPDRRGVERLYDVRLKCFRDSLRMFQQRFLYECDGGLFEDGQKTPFWSQDREYSRRICRNISQLRLLWGDLFYLDHFFRPATIDLMYVSDITLVASQNFLLLRLSATVALLKRGGCLAANADSGEKFLGNGIPVADMLERNSARLGLVTAKARGALKVFEKA